MLVVDLLGWCDRTIIPLWGAYLTLKVAYFMNSKSSWSTVYALRPVIPLATEMEHIYNYRLQSKIIGRDSYLLTVGPLGWKRSCTSWFDDLLATVHTNNLTCSSIMTSGVSFKPPFSSSHLQSFRKQSQEILNTFKHLPSFVPSSSSSSIYPFPLSTEFLQAFFSNLVPTSSTTLMASCSKKLESSLKQVELALSAVRALGIGSMGGLLRCSFLIHSKSISI